jgi:hypothetical protein
MLKSEVLLVYFWGSSKSHDRQAAPVFENGRSMMELGDTAAILG